MRVSAWRGAALERWLPARAGSWGDVLVALALAATMGLALALRLFGIDWDAGYSYSPHPDERSIIYRVEAMSLPPLGEIASLLNAETSPLHPGGFAYGSLPAYALKLVHALVPGQAGDLRMTGRAISALADVGVVFFTYLLGARLFGRRQGLFAALLVSLAVIHVQLSHFLTVDVLLGLLTIAALYFMHRVAAGGALRDSLIAGAIVGLGMATKVSVAPIYLALIMAHLLHLARGLDGRDGASLSARLAVAGTGLLASVGASAAAFLIMEPYALLDWARFAADNIEQSEMARRIRDYPYTRQYVDTTAYLYHARQLAAFGLGWPLGLAAGAGLAYAALRGLPWRAWGPYLFVGWALPAALLLASQSLGVIGLACAVSFAALAATLPFRPRATWGGVLLLAWAAPYLLITGAFDVKIMRYLLPVTPLLLLFASQMLFHLHDAVRARRPRLRHVVTGVIVALAASTALYAFAYASVYREPHTAVRTSQWLNENAEAGSVILMEHWEEGIPDVGRFAVAQLPMYEDDSVRKLGDLAASLAGADYVVFYSNRLYGTIPRLRDRYPLSGAYYRLLFGEELGYRLANVETSYPRIAGLAWVDDTYVRAGLPRPESPRGGGVATFNLGYADESFSVYDHPKGLVFENVERLDAEAIRALIVEEAAWEPEAHRALPERRAGLLLTDQEARERREGGTWSDIVRLDGLGARAPLIAWLLAVEVMALAALPLAFALFRSLPDRGYLLAKTLGVLLSCLAAWWLASLGWMPFTAGAVLVGVLAVALASCAALIVTWSSFLAFVRERWRFIALCEGVFLLAFLAFVLVRMSNPDLWHPWMGGEKPMDTAYLNAVLKSVSMPPYDPWHAGGYLNYYYWGQFVTASIIHLTGIDTAVAVNLAVPTFFALTVGGAFSVVYNLAESARRRINAAEGGWRSGGGERFWRWSPVYAGVAGALFVCVLGNLDGAVQTYGGVARALFFGGEMGEFDFWRSSRMMPPDPPGSEITEFPFFTFLFGDLHAHLMAMPFTLLVVGTSAAVVLGARSAAGRGWGLRDVALAATAGLGVGALQLINSWDYPTYLLISAGAALLAATLRHGGVGLTVIVEAGAKALLIAAVGFAAFLPFHMTYERAISGIEATTNQTPLWQFLLISGLFIFIVGTFVLTEARGWLPRLLRMGWRPIGRLAAAPSGGLGARAIRLAPVFAGLGFLALVAVLKMVEVLGSSTPFALPLLALALLAGLRAALSARSDAASTAFALLLAAAALAIVIGVEFVRVEEDIDRMNTVFKFYLQVWVLLALAAAYMLWRLGYERRGALLGKTKAGKAWLFALALLVFGASIYPILGSQDRLRTRFDTTLPLTLDGMAYMRGGRMYNDREGRVDLTADYDSIRWIQRNIQGSPVTLEAVTPSYRWGGRISVYTGLPTIIGWEWHQKQQRWNYRASVEERIADARRIYDTPDDGEAIKLLDKYNVEYVYVGQVERLYHPSYGIEKFERGLGGALEVAYENDKARLYRVAR